MARIFQIGVTKCQHFAGIAGSVATSGGGSRGHFGVLWHAKIHPDPDATDDTKVILLTIIPTVVIVAKTTAKEGCVVADIDSSGRPPRSNVVEPGFRVFDDGSVATYGADLGRPFFANLEDAATWVNAAVNGAHSVFPGLYNAGRAEARGVGLLGGNEFRRFGQEADAVGTGLIEAAKRPELVGRAASQAWGAMRENLLFPYFAGRLAMGIGTRLGPVAAMGDVLRAVEDGHNWLDGVFYNGVLGIPSQGRR
jgi:hypothetical protein